MKPWEKYAAQQAQTPADVPDGPWKKYGKPADTPQQPQEAMSAADVLSGAVDNFLPSAGQFAKDLAQPILHPIQTAQSLGDIVGGVAAKAGIGDHDQAAADAVGQFFVQRYGGIENVKRTMAQDPVGFLSDLATALSGGAMLGAKAPGVLGRAASAAGKAADIVDPVANAGRVVGGVARGVGNAASYGTGFLTGVGPTTVQEMARAGREGNVHAVEQMRGGSARDAVDDARSAVSEMRSDRGGQYQQDMAGVFADKTPLSFQPVFRAIGDARSEVYRNGNAVDAAAASALDEATGIVKQWRDNQTNTPGDFDAMHRRLSAIGQDAANPFTARVVKKITDSVVETVSRARPEYPTALLGYTNRSKAIDEIERELSLSRTSSDSTAARKLLSSMRNNVSTNFGERERLMRELAVRQPQLPGMLAGNEMSGVMPRGLAKYAAGGGALYGLGTPAGLPIAALTLAASSPRVVGEAAYKIGQVGRGADKAAQGVNKVTGLDKLTPQQRRLIRRMLLNQSGRVTAPVSDEERRVRGH